MTKIDFDLAVEKLDNYIQTKTVHGVNGIKDKMTELCGMEFENAEDKQDFASICSNFEKYCLITKTTSFGRKQFEVLFEQGFEVQDSKEAALKMLEPQEDPLPDVMQEGFTDIGMANAYIAGLEGENKALKAKVDVYEETFRKMKELLNPWA